jgi:4-amino-4-deoxy-L-arabinose transferase-like glycosyltransferase
MSLPSRSPLTATPEFASRAIWRRLEPAIFVIALLIILAGVLHLSWIGFVASDDGYYVSSGLGWLNDFPYVPNHFGTVRAAVGIPIALMIGLFGYTEFSVVLSSVLFFVIVVLTTFYGLSRVLDRKPAFAAAAGLATVPLFALKATIPSADVPELCFVVVSFWFFWAAIEYPSRARPLLLMSGVAIALAFSAHEVTSALLFFYGPLFLVGYRIDRQRYLLIGIGFLAVIAIEALYYGVVAGDPLHRWALLMSGTSVRDRVDVGFLELAAGGTVHVWEPIDPLLMFFSKHDFGMLGYLAVPALWWGFVSVRHDMRAPVRLVRLLGLLAFVWATFAAVALKNLILLPRYYMVVAYALYVCIAIWLVVEVWPKRPKLAAIFITLGVLINAMAIMVDNKNPRFGERALVDYLKDHPGRIVTDPMTSNNVIWYCEWQGVKCEGVDGRAPREGDLYFHNARNADHSNRFVPQSQVALYQPKPNWPVVWSTSSRGPALTSALEYLHLNEAVPSVLAAKLLRRADSVTVHQVTRVVELPAK